MKKKAIVGIVLAVVAVACVIAVVSKQKSGVEGIAAVYGTHEITLEAVEQYRENVALAGGEAPQSDRAVVDRLLRSLILLEEAEKRGIAATEAEIQAQLDATKQWYAIMKKSSSALTTIAPAPGFLLRNICALSRNCSLKPLPGRSSSMR